MTNTHSTIPTGASYTETICSRPLSPRQRKKLQQHYARNYGAYLPREREAIILDLGCSEGLALAWLADEGYTRAQGIDSDPAAIARAKQDLCGRLPGSSLLVDDIMAQMRSRAEDSVDAVLLFNVAEHLKKHEFVDLVRHVKRVLKEGGVFIVQTLNTENPLNYGLFARDFTHEIPFTANSLSQAMILGGFASSQLVVAPVRYRLSVTSLPLTVTSAVLGALMKAAAFLMRIRIRETAPMISCVARKQGAGQRSDGCLTHGAGTGENGVRPREEP